MKKLFLLSLAVLLIAGYVWAADIPQSEDPKQGPAIWYLPVFNNTTALTKGDVVVWDISSSTGDNDNYVTTTTTADTFAVAGVVWPSDIAAGGRGTVAIKGVVDVNVRAGTTKTGSLLCTYTTAGAAGTCSVRAGDANAFGFTVKDQIVTTTDKSFAQSYIFIR